MPEAPWSDEWRGEAEVQTTQIEQEWVEDEVADGNDTLTAEAPQDDGNGGVEEDWGNDEEDEGWGEYEDWGSPKCDAVVTITSPSDDGEG